MFAFGFPFGTGVHQKASIWMTSQRQAAFSLLDQSVAMPSRNIDPTLRIERESTAALKHQFTPLKYTKTYFSPL